MLFVGLAFGQLAPAGLLVRAGTGRVRRRV